MHQGTHRSLLVAKRPKATVLSKHKSQGFLWHINKSYNISREKFPSLFVSQAVQAMAAFIKSPITGITLCHFGLSLESSAIRWAGKSTWFSHGSGSSARLLYLGWGPGASQNMPPPDSSLCPFEQVRRAMPNQPGLHTSLVRFSSFP